MELSTESIATLKELVATPTPTGSEHAGMMVLARRLAATTGLKSSIDVHGNLHCVLDRGAKKTVMIEGHCDEIGFMVQYIDDDGFVYVSALGGVTVPLVAAERIVFAGKKGPVNGVFGARPPHLMTAKERENVAPKELKTIACDIGARNRAEAEELLSVGDSAVVDAGWRDLAGTRVSCRGWDNRIGAFIMCEAFAEIAGCTCGTGVNVHYVASVQEEVGLVGGYTTAYDIKPDIGICCDVTFASDAQKEDRKTVGDIRLGNGAVIGVGPTYHRGLGEHFKAIAGSQKIPYQLQARSRGTGTCAWAMRMTGSGAAVSQISVPLRYMHSPVEVIDLADVASTIKLVSKGVSALDDGFNLLPEQP